MSTLKVDNIEPSTGTNVAINGVVVGNVQQIDSVSNLSTASTSAGTVEIRGFHDASENRPRRYTWQAGKNKNLHDGGKYIDPTHSLIATPATGTWWTFENVTLGIWELEDTGFTHLLDFGIRVGSSSYASNNTTGIQKVFDNYKNIQFPQGNVYSNGLALNGFWFNIKGYGKSNSQLTIDTTGIGIHFASTANSGNMNISGLEIEIGDNATTGIKLGSTLYAAYAIKWEDVYLNSKDSTANSSVGIDFHYCWWQTFSDCLIEYFNDNVYFSNTVDGNQQTTTIVFNNQSNIQRALRNNVRAEASAKIDKVYFQEVTMEYANNACVYGRSLETFWHFDDCYFESNCFEDVTNRTGNDSVFDIQPAAAGDITKFNEVNISGCAFHEIGSVEVSPSVFEATKFKVLRFIHTKVNIKNTFGLFPSGEDTIDVDSTVYMHFENAGGLTTAVDNVKVYESLAATVTYLERVNGATVTSPGRMLFGGDTYLKLNGKVIDDLSLEDGNLNVELGDITASAGNINAVGGDLGVSSGNITGINSHLIFSASTDPTLASLDGNISGFLIDTASTDIAGKVQLNTGGATTAASAICRVTFATAYNVSPKVVITPLSAEAVAAGLYVSNIAPSIFDVHSANGLTVASLKDIFSYMVVG